MQVKSIAKCSNSVIPLTFIKLLLILSLTSLFCLFVAGRFTQVLQYFISKFVNEKVINTFNLVANLLGKAKTQC